MNPNPSSLPDPNALLTPSSASPWTVQASGAEPLPVASYFARFVGVEDFASPEKGIEGKWKWTWEVVTGTQKGRPATALTDRKLTPATHSGRLISGMAGRPLQAGEDVAALVKSFVGKTWCVNVAPGPKGGKPSVQSVSAPPEM